MDMEDLEDQSTLPISPTRIFSTNLARPGGASLWSQILGEQMQESEFEKCLERLTRPLIIKTEEQGGMMRGGTTALWDSTYLVCMRAKVHSSVPQAEK